MGLELNEKSMIPLIESLPARSTVDMPLIINKKLDMEVFNDYRKNMQPSRNNR